MDRMVLAVCDCGTELFEKDVVAVIIDELAEAPNMTSTAGPVMQQTHKILRCPKCFKTITTEIK